MWQKSDYYQKKKRMQISSHLINYAKIFDFKDILFLAALHVPIVLKFWQNLLAIANVNVFEKKREKRQKDKNVPEIKMFRTRNINGAKHIWASLKMVVTPGEHKWYSKICFWKIAKYETLVGTVPKRLNLLQQRYSDNRRSVTFDRERALKKLLAISQTVIIQQSV